MHYEVSSDKVIHKHMDDEIMIINLDTGHYYSIEGVGVPMWEALVASAPVEALITECQGAYPGHAGVDSAAQTLIDDLVAANLLAPAGGPAAALPDIEWPATYAAPKFDTYDDVSELIAMDPPLPELE